MFKIFRWNLRHEFQGIESPVDRDESDLDPAAKYHVVANVEYLRYFIAHIIQFQFHKALCIVADEYDPEDPAKPLHNCDITNSIEAGTLLKLVKLVLKFYKISNFIFF